MPPLPAPAPLRPPPSPDRVDEALAVLIADPQAAARLARQALLQARGEGDTQAAAMALLALAMAELRDGQEAATATSLAEAEVLLRGLDDARAHGLAQHLRAQLLRRQGQLDEAVQLLQALTAQRDQRPLVDAFHSAMALGTALSMLDRFDESLGAYYDGLALARQSGIASLEVNALNNLGSLQLDLYNLEDALPLLRQCLAGALAIGSRRQRIFAAGNLVQCLCAMGQPEEAMALARTHLMGVIRPEDPPSLQRDEELAHVHAECGQLAEAQRYLARAPQRDPLSNPTTALRAWLQARLLLADGRAAEALAHCQAQQALIDDEGVVPLDRVRLAEVAAEAAERVGDHRHALEALRRAYAVRELLLGRAARARQISLHIEHEVAGTRRERDAARALAQRLELANAALQAQVRANEDLHRKLEALAMEDPLTGLCNRRHLFQAGRALLEQARRRGEPVAVALIDLDHFKAINDRHGHDCGDQVLQAFGELARQSVRAGDICCRYGGEEFVIVFAGLCAEAAATRLRQILDAFVQQAHVGAGGLRFGASFSAGVSATASADESLSALLSQADRALYEAKEAGRRCVRVAR